MLIGISGIGGRVGQLLKTELISNGYSVIGFARHNSETNTSNIEEFCRNSDAIIDFSSPECLSSLLIANEKYKKPIVSGTTPMNPELINLIKECAKSYKICWSANMSKGIAIMRKISAEVIKSLPESEIEILEAHHNKKVDAPSGTAILLGEDIAKARNIALNAVKNTDRNHKRQDGEIGFASIRGGKTIGEHSIFYYFGDEIIEIKHTALSRDIFAKGAINAMQKLITLKDNIGFFDYIDLI